MSNGSGSPTMQGDSGSPLRLTVMLMVVIFIAEALVMVLFYLLGESASLLSGFVDASLLSVLISLPMYYLVFRPMNLQHRRLQRSQRWLQLITENLPEALISIDGSSSVLSFNPAAEKMFAYSADEIVGQSINLLMDEPNASQHNAYIQRYLETGQAQVLGQVREVMAKRRDGTMFPVEIQVREISVDGQPCFVGMLRDITRSKQEQARREQMQQRIERTQRLESLGVMAGGIAHDFNNILAAIMGNAELLGLSVRGAGAETDECLDNIERGCNHAADLCRQMLAYAGRGNYRIEPVNVSRLVGEMEKLIRISVPRSIQIDKQLPEDLPATEADKSQLEQVILNLLTNAAEAIGDREGGLIRIETRKVRLSARQIESMEHAEGQEPGDYIELLVADNGSGIRSEDRPRLFEPFFTTKFTGRGLGMSAILGILRSHHGAIRIESVTGQGTTMRVYFPSRDAVQPGSAPEIQVHEVEATWRGLGTVLVIDDEADLRVIACRMLERMGFETLTAANGEEGLAVVREHRDRLTAVLLDLTMPVMGGIQTMEILRERWPELPVLISSGYGEATLEEVRVDLKPAGVVPKPFRFAELREALMHAVQVPAAMLAGSGASGDGDGI